MDRASGSGVFARDPDALLDLTELEVSDNLIRQQQDKLTCEIALNWLKRFNKDMLLTQDDLVTPSKILDAARDNLMKKSYQLMAGEIDEAKKAVASRTAWRIEGTLREFPKFEPLNVWFDYPIHRKDNVGVLKDCGYEGDMPGWQKNFGKKKSNQERQEERKDGIMSTYNACSVDGKVTVQDLAKYSGKSEKTIRRHLKEHGGFWIDGNEVGLKDKDKIE